MGYNSSRTKSNGDGGPLVAAVDLVSASARGNLGLDNCSETKKAKCVTNRSQIQRMNSFTPYRSEKKTSLFILAILAGLIAVSAFFGVPFIRQSQLHAKLSNPLMQAAIIDAARNSSSAVEHNTAEPVVLKEIPANLATLKAKQIMVKPWAICIKPACGEDILCENRAYPNGENWVIYQPLADGRNLFYNEQ